MLDVETGDVVATGLSMPHSPRLYRDTLWMLQAGTGEFGRIDQVSGRFEPVCFLPGFARGLAFIGDHAVIGLSRPRENRTFEGLVLNERLEREGVAPKCAICMVNLKTGDLEHRLETWPSISPAYAGMGPGRRSSIRLRIFRSRSLGTATSANWNVM